MEQPDSEWWRSWFGRGYLALYDEYLAERTPVEIDQLEALLTLRRRSASSICHAARAGMQSSWLAAVTTSPAPTSLPIFSRWQRNAGGQVASEFDGSRQTCAGRLWARHSMSS